MKKLLDQIIDIQNSINEQATIENRLGDNVWITLGVAQVAVLSYALGLASSMLLPWSDEPPKGRAAKVKP